MNPRQPGPGAAFLLDDADSGRVVIPEMGTLNDAAVDAILAKTASLDPAAPVVGGSVAANSGESALAAGPLSTLRAILASAAVDTRSQELAGSPGGAGLARHRLAELCGRFFALESMAYRLAGDLRAASHVSLPDAAGDAVCDLTDALTIECSIVRLAVRETCVTATHYVRGSHSVGGSGLVTGQQQALEWVHGVEDSEDALCAEMVERLLTAPRRTQLLDAGRRTSIRLVQSEMPYPDMFDDPADVLAGQGRDIRSAALFLLYQADEHLRDEPVEHQELFAALGAVVSAAYCVQSVAPRCMLLRDAPPAIYRSILQAADVAIQLAAESAHRSARYVLDSLPGLEDSVDWRDEPFTGIRNLLDRIIRRDSSPIELRRALAAAAMEAGGAVSGVQADTRRN